MSKTGFVSKEVWFSFSWTESLEEEAQRGLETT